jgi:hypothetical protein
VLVLLEGRKEQDNSSMPFTGIQIDHDKQIACFTKQNGSRYGD